MKTGMLTKLILMILYVYQITPPQKLAELTKQQNSYYLN